MNNQDNYRMLGLKEGCSEDDIKRAYIFLAKKYHPDKAQEQFKEVNQERNFVGIHKAYSEMTEDIKHRKQEKTKKFNDYMNYVNTIIDIFNDSEDSESDLNEEYFSNQQESMEKACHKIMKVLPHACKDSLQSTTAEADQPKHTKKESQDTSGTGKDSSVEDGEHPQKDCNSEQIPSEQAILNRIRRKKLIFKVSHRNRC